jgi:uncharacterized protein with HEPN domain
VRADLERLDDILEILEAASKISERVQRGRDRFDADEDTRLSVIHLIEMIGEATSRLSAQLREKYPEVPWRGAIAMRNRVIHGYFDIDYDRVWEAAAFEVPSFAAQVQVIRADVGA